MKAIDEPLICPYTGLRSFTEEESLYFKGRDEQVDQVALLLERNKFLMLTGASGEGKSSLIYAGLIPNARAGFFKAKYTNWIISDFRPERTPVKNMAAAVAETFGTEASTVETELRRGFSSLIDLYTNSSYYTQEEDDGWKELSVAEQKNRTRGAANLLIIVDQFEEFFTNPENYLHDAPSQDSQIVVNLALETARIALQRNLPVYVVCTMRSDYIGQCSAFRGLPEYIGFSQFFVPRLKRKEIKQVIEEPALLSGNRITRRLVERLVYDLADGIDQLPILQHALRQVWLAAKDGLEEMDLIHYAMVGGMPADELPDTDKAQYAAWFEQVPENQRKFYEQPGLNRIIEIHASRLYEGAWVYYNANHPEHPITQKDAKRIIALTFACLTKIDDSRAVRNRMTLREITNIIHQPNLTPTVVGGVLNLFRESNNSFIRPYKTEDEGTHVLSADTVLDITHESLIRNWGLLNKWANQEFEFYSTFLDFRKQLTRWNASGKSSDFLLPLGPLTYFENWYTECRPNAYWINRYAENHDQPEQTLQASENLLSDTTEFIRRSASKVMLTRAFMKYGARRIATVFALTAMVLLTGFYWYDAQRKSNEHVEKQVVEKAHRLLLSNEVGEINKAAYMLTEERLKTGSLREYLSGLTSKREKIALSIAAYRLLLYYDKHCALPLKTELMDSIVNELRHYGYAEPDKATFLLEQQNQFQLLLAYDEYYNPSPRIADVVIPEIAKSQYHIVSYFFSRTAPYKQVVPTELNMAIQLWLTFGKPAGKEIEALLAQVSPFAEGSRAVFDRYYVKGNYESNGRIASDYNGGHHTLASLYAAVGDVKNVIRVFELLPDTYFRSPLFNNYNNILGYFYQYHHQDELTPFTDWLTRHYPTDDPLTLYRNTVIRAGYLPGIFPINIEKGFARSYSGYIHVNLGLAKREDFFALAAEYERVAVRVSNPDERNYLLASHYKRIAVLYNKYLTDRGLPIDQGQFDGWLDKAWGYYRQISENYLAGNISVNYRYFTDGIRTVQAPRKMVFLFPDYRDGWFANKFNSDVFVNYLFRKGLLSTYYTTPETIGLLHDWVASGNEVFLYKRLGEGTGYFQNDMQISDTLLIRILAFAKASPASRSFDGNLLHLILANRYFERGDTLRGLDHYQHLQQDQLLGSGSKYEYLSQAYFINSMIDLGSHLAQSGHTSEAIRLIGKYQTYEKAFFFAAAADELYKTYQPKAFTFLDSAYSIALQLDYSTVNVAGTYNELDPRRMLTYVLGKVGGERANTMSSDLIRELPEASRFRGITSMIMGTAIDGNYYTALRIMPSDLTEDQEISCYTSILGQVARGQQQDPRWKGMDEAWLWEFTYFLAPL